MSRHPSPQFALAREHLSACSARLSYGSYRHLGQQLLAAFAVNAVCIAALFVLPDAEAIFDAEDRAFLEIGAEADDDFEFE